MTDIERAQNPLTLFQGPANCAGRALALHEMRTVLATLVRRFDFVFPPGYKAKDWIDQLKDRFLLIRGKLNVVITARDQALEQRARSRAVT